MIRTVGLTKRYKDTVAVDALDLHIKEGELFSLLGVNGAGKTTTIKMLCSLVGPSAGDAFLDGKSVVSEAGEVKKIIGVSPQETAIAPNLTVRESLRLMCGVHGMSKAQTDNRVGELIEEFNLSELADKRAGRLSGGWQRRLSIAMALISKPKILFLDEPTLGLDVLARADLWETIQALKGKITVVLTTHYMEEAEQLSDRIAVMRDGKLLTLGTAAELCASVHADTLEKAFVAIVKGAKI